MQVTIIEITHENAIGKDEVLTAINQAFQKNLGLKPLLFNAHQLATYHLERQDR